MGQVVTQLVRMETETCCSCGIVFAMPDFMVSRLRTNGGSFYCPNGHQQHYTKTEVQRLKDKLAEQIQQTTILAKRALAAEQAEEKAAKEIRRLKKRASAGVCPCCNRTFQQLARHMKTKHPEITHKE